MTEQELAVKVWNRLGQDYRGLNDGSLAAKHLILILNHPGEQLF